MTGESIQKRLERVRPCANPRLQYERVDPSTGYPEVVSLPFVVGVMGDYSGTPLEQLPLLQDRKFVEIDRDNFNEVMQSMTPRVAYRVDEKLSGAADTTLVVGLRFNCLDDFSPENVAQQVEPLCRLLESRIQLEELKIMVNENNQLKNLLEQVLENATLRQDLGRALNVVRDVQEL